MRRKKREKKIKEETYSLDYTMIVWLNEHLKVYRECADKCIDLEYHKYEYKGKERPFKWFVDRLIGITEILKVESIYFPPTERTGKLIDEMYDILKLVHFSLWW